MTDVVFVFEVHQPTDCDAICFGRAKSFGVQPKKSCSTTILTMKQIVTSLNARLANATSLQPNHSRLNRPSQTEKKKRIFLQRSGVFLEQCEMFDPDTLETFKQLQHPAVQNSSTKPTTFHRKPLPEKKNLLNKSSCIGRC